MDSLLSFLQKEYKFDCNLRFLFEKYSQEEIVKEILVWLKDDSVNYNDTITFARDFIIGSNLSQKEKDSFYKELQKQGFFERLNTFLYADNFSNCSATIYNIGKFSHDENAGLLETAYETNFRLNNPILSYRCLSELSWLHSKKVSRYIAELELENSISSKLTLLYYGENRGDNPEFRRLISDKEFISFIIPNPETDNIEEEVIAPLFYFEIYISGLYDSRKKISLDKNEFEGIAKEYFKTFTHTPDSEAEKAHKEFIEKLTRGVEE